MNSKTVTISAGSNSLSNALSETWEYRDLLLILARKQISIRYKQTVLGVLWVILQPLLTMAIFSFIFGRFVKLPSGQIPYPLFAYSGIVLWSFFSQAVTRTSTSLISEERLIGKVYFPRCIVPMASVVAAAFDFAITFSLLVPILLIYGVSPGLALIWLPVAFLFTMLLAFGIGLVFASLSIRYRDVQQILPFFVQIWMYASPVIYSIEILSPEQRPIFFLNPMAGLLGLFRYSVLGVDPPSVTPLALTAVLVLASLTFGLVLFLKIERDMVDYL